MNTILQFKVDNHKITYLDNTFLTTGNKNIVKCSFDFSNEWLNMQAFALFYCGDNKYIVEINDNMCGVPNEVLTNTTTTIFSVSCYSGNIRTTNKASVQMILGGDTEAPEPPEPQPDVATYVMSLDKHIQFIRNNNGTLEWYDGVNWNPAGGGGGTGGVTPEEVAQAISNHNTSGSAHNDIRNAINAKQDTLVSGTSIKTINNISLLGSGNIDVSGGGTGTESDPIYTADKPNIALKSEIPTPRNFTTNPISLTSEVSGILPSTNVDLTGVQGQIETIDNTIGTINNSISTINDEISDINDTIGDIELALQEINGEVI